MLTRKHLIGRTRRDIAAIFAWMLGAEINESDTTHSIYIRFAGNEIRFSDHTKYGMQNPMHVLHNGSLDDLIRKFRVAAIAARRNFKTHAEVYAAIGRGDEKLANAAGF